MLKLFAIRWIMGWLNNRNISRNAQNKYNIYYVKLNDCNTPYSKPTKDLRMNPFHFRTCIWISAIVFLLSLPGIAETDDGSAVEAGIWTMDYAKAVQVAKEKKLPILLNFTGSDWCGWCKLMARSVFAKEAWKRYAKDNLILVTIDFPRDPNIVPKKYKERNNQLQYKYGVTGYPTYIIVDEDGATILGKLGAGRNKTPESFIRELKTLLKFRDVEIEAFVEELPPDLAKSYKTTIGKLKTLRDELTNWLKTRPPKTEENISIYNNYLAQIENAKQQFKDVEALAAKAIAL